MKPKFSRIGLELSLVFSVVIVGLMTIAGGITLTQTETVLQDELKFRSELSAKNLATFGREAMIPTPDLFMLGYLAQQAAKQESVVSVTFYDRKGNPIVSKGRKIAVSGEEVYDLSWPMTLEQEQIGNVKVVFSKEPINQIIKENKRKIIIATGCVLAPGIILVSWVSARLVRPVNKLAQVANEVGAGNFNLNVPVGRANEIGILARSFNKMVEGLKEREKIRDTFGRFVSPQIAEAAISGKIHLGGERKEISVLFCDIRDFTHFSEKLSPEQVVEFLNQYFTRLVKIVLDHKGTVNKFIGDAMLVMFGAPINMLDHAKVAVEVALKIRDSLVDFNRERQKLEKSAIRVGMAINSGEAVAGNIGSPDRMEYTVIGDTVNVASRLEGINKRLGTDILVTEATYKNVKEIYDFRPFEPMPVRGRVGLVKLYQLLGPSTKGASSYVARAFPGSSTH